MADNKGILYDMLQPFGKGIVDPNGAVSGQLPNAAALAKAEELKRQQALAREQSMMEVAAQAAPIPEAQTLSKWNPWVMLFGQPEDSNSKGLLSRKE